jgi:MYXO-CTERM domain-containing protein
MRLAASIAGLLLLVPGALAGSGFGVDGAIDFSDGTVPGGLGSALTFSGEPNLTPGGFARPAGIWNGDPNQTGIAIASADFSVIAHANLYFGSVGWTDGAFRGAYFTYDMAGPGIPSAPLSIGSESFEAVFLANFDAGVSNIDFETAYIYIDGFNQRFEGFDNINDAGYSMTLTGGDGEPTQMWVIAGVVPTPGAVGLLGLAGFAASRRRR